MRLPLLLVITVFTWFFIIEALEIEPSQHDSILMSSK